MTADWQKRRCSRRHALLRYRYEKYTRTVPKTVTQRQYGIYSPFNWVYSTTAMTVPHCVRVRDQPRQRDGIRKSQL